MSRARPTQSDGRPRRRRRTTSGSHEEQQARIHRRTRQAHAQEIAEDYCEVIADLITNSGEARAVDIARRLGVTHVTVAKTVARLTRQGLVTARPYRAIFLTDDGARLATDARRRHDVVVRFLQAIGVSEETAQSDAEGIEHHVSRETLAAFERVAKGKSS